LFCWHDLLLLKGNLSIKNPLDCPFKQPRGNFN